MPTTTDFSFGDVVLVPFPFTDQSASKKRPAVVVSSVLFHRSRADVILMAITSQATPSTRDVEASIEQWKAAGLLKPSVLKPVITTVEKKMILKRLGSLQTADVTALRDCLKAILGD